MDQANIDDNVQRCPMLVLKVSLSIIYEFTM